MGGMKTEGGPERFEDVVKDGVADTEAIRRWLPVAALADVERFAEWSRNGHAAHALALEELERRRFELLRKPHWSLSPLFWVAVLTMAFAAIAAWPVIREWPVIQRWLPAAPPAQTTPTCPAPPTP